MHVKKTSTIPRKLLRDRNAPSKPLTSYNLFYKQRISQLKTDAPASRHGLNELNKIIGSDWSALSEGEKLTYQEEAKLNKQRHDELMKEYKKTSNYQDFLKLQRKKIAEHKRKNADVDGKKGAGGKKRRTADAEESEDFGADDANGFNIPIFTSEFLEHNRLRETTLRQLKKQVICLEEETALLSKHVETLEAAVTEQNNEATRRSEGVSELENELTNLYGNISDVLADLPLPDTRIRITPGNVDDYLEGVCSLAASGRHPDFVAKVKKILTELDLE